MKKKAKKPVKKIVKKVAKKSVVSRRTASVGKAKKSVKKVVAKAKKSARPVAKKVVKAVSKKVNRAAKVVVPAAKNAVKKVMETVNDYTPSQETVNATAKNFAKKAVTESAPMRHSIAAAATAAYEAGKDLVDNIGEGIEEGLAEEEEMFDDEKIDKEEN